MKSILLFLAIGACLCINKVQAQALTDSTRFVIVLNDNTEFIGFIITRDAREILIQKDNGERLYIPAYVVKSIAAITDSNLRKGEYLSENPQASRYFYTPTAIPIKKSEGYIQSIYGVVWQFQYGISDHFSVGIGTPIIGAPIWITPKYSFKLGKKVWGALGSQIGSLGWINGGWGSYFGIGYGVLTIGSEQANFTFGGGVLGTRIKRDIYVVTDPFTGEGYNVIQKKFNSSPAFSVSGMKRIHKNMLVMAEFWGLPNVDRQGSLFFGGPGLRLIRDANLWDFGVWFFSVSDNAGENTSFPVPYISYTWKLN